MFPNLGHLLYAAGGAFLPPPLAASPPQRLAAALGLGDCYSRQRGSIEGDQQRAGRQLRGADADVAAAAEAVQAAGGLVEEQELARRAAARGVYEQCGRHRNKTARHKGAQVRTGAVSK